MQKNKYKLSKLAQAHLRKIKSYTVNNFSEMQWRSYKDTLLTGFQMLADNPAVGRSCDEIYQADSISCRQAYRLLYKEDGFILVVAILGQSLLPQNHL